MGKTLTIQIVRVWIRHCYLDVRGANHIKHQCIRLSRHLVDFSQFGQAAWPGRCGPSALLAASGPIFSRCGPSALPHCCKADFFQVRAFGPAPLLANPQMQWKILNVQFEFWLAQAHGPKNHLMFD